ncbi:GGDEF domain-containing protein [Pseudomonas bohemica]|uniref:GGDEF domain-containing protein n=1 Tax=Pseudomonas bohemica TaxID=2044872 RepID=UPI0018FE4681|nr:GGDEF domain-containing protein [Pseudomonas bohemica]
MRTFKISDISIPKASLHGKLVTGCLILLGLSLFLACILLSTIGADYRRAKLSYENLKFYQSVIAAANAVSAERGPTNTLLGGNFLSSSDAWARLQTFRNASDEKLETVIQISKPITQITSTPILNSKSELQKARNAVDKELAIDFNSRTLPSIQEPIDRMFRAVDAIMPLINATALNSNGPQGDFVDEALIGQKLFEIREYAGRIGSILTPYIAMQKSISNSDQAKIEQIRGRITQLWELTKPYLLRYPSLLDKVNDVELKFFGEGINLINTLQSQGITGRFLFSTQTMTDAIVPTFLPLEVIRVSYLNLMATQSSNNLASASAYLFAIVFLVCIVISINIILMIWTQRVIFVPLLLAKEAIIALSEDREIDDKRNDHTGREINDVFRAISILQGRLIERRNLTQELKMHALTDGLTGLLNRRAFDELGNGHVFFSHVGLNVGLIVIDIDNFKSINDSLGHPTGDIVLRSLADTLRAHVRSSDLIIRHGGEEFAIVMSEVSLEQLKASADKLRAAVETSKISISDGNEISITASFGVSIGERLGAKWLEVINQADKALYLAKHAGRNCVRSIQ